MFYQLVNQRLSRHDTMAVKRVCCCSVVTWCYLLIILDMLAGAIFAVKHSDMDWGESWKAKADKASYWGGKKQCLDLGLGNVGLIIEMSLLVISLLALVALCCRKAVLLLPYLGLKMVIIGMHIYVCVQYSLHWDDCSDMLLGKAFTLFFSFCVCSVVFGAYKMIKGEYVVVERNP